MNHEGVVWRFAKRQINRNHNDVTWKSGSVFSTGKVLYSYGHHFPLAVFLGERPDMPAAASGRLFIKNGDRYSNSTSKHQRLVQDKIKNSPTVSFSALDAAGIRGIDLTSENIGEFTSDIREGVARNKETGEFVHYPDYTQPGHMGPTFRPPSQGMFIPDGKEFVQGVDEWTTGVWHILGGTLMHIRGVSYLSGLDEGSYYLIRLPYKVDTIHQAFESLKPWAVRDSETLGLKVKRQGEWFFIPTNHTLKSLGFKKADAVIKAIPDDRPDAGIRNQHHARVVIKDGEVYASGIVRHKDRRGKRATGQHRALVLGETWHRVVRNTEVASFTARNGGVD